MGEVHKPELKIADTPEEAGFFERAAAGEEAANELAGRIGKERTLEEIRAAAQPPVPKSGKKPMSEEDLFKEAA